MDNDIVATINDCDERSDNSRGRLLIGLFQVMLYQVYANRVVTRQAERRG